MAKDDTKIALLIGSPHGGLEGVGHDIDLMGALLTRRGFDLTKCVDECATRENILQELETLRGRVRSNSTIVFYYSGHGGRCYLEGSDRAHNYLVPMDHDRTTNFRGITDFELAPIFYDISRTTPNVTVILDCCHASTMVRDDVRDDLFGGASSFEPRSQERIRRWEGATRYAMPEDMRSRLAVFSKRAPELPPDSNPHVVRIVATASGSPAFEYEEAGTCGGYFTRELCAVLKDDPHAPMSWDSIVRRVRENVIAKRGSTTQRPELEGPSSRLAFSLQNVADIVNRTTLVYRESDQTAWIRAGTMHGLSEGDELNILGAIAHDENEDEDERRPPEPSVVAHAEIIAIHDDCAEVRLTQGVGNDRPPAGSAAMFDVLARHRTIFLQSPETKKYPILRAEIGRNVRLRDTDDPEQADLRVHVRDDVLRLEGRRELEVHRVDRPVTRNVIADLCVDLDEIARGSVLEEVVASSPPTPIDTQWSIEPFIKPPGEHDFRSMARGERVQLGSKIRFKLEHRTPAKPTLYVNVLDRGFSRRVGLLNPSQPAGVQLGAPEDSPTRVAWVPGSTMEFDLVWPAEVPRMPGLTEEYIFIVSERPLDLRCLLAGDEVTREQRLTALKEEMKRALPENAKETTSPRIPDTHPDAPLGTPLRWAVERFSFTVELEPEQPSPIETKPRSRPKWWERLWFTIRSLGRG